MKKPALVKSLQRAVELETGTHIILSLLDRGASSPSSWPTLTGSQDTHRKTVEAIVNGLITQNIFILQLQKPLLSFELQVLICIGLQDWAVYSVPCKDRVHNTALVLINHIWQKLMLSNSHNSTSYVHMLFLFIWHHDMYMVQKVRMDPTYTVYYNVHAVTYSRSMSAPSRAKSSCM